MKHASTTSMMVRMTLSDLPSTDTGVHKHRTISTVVEIGLYDILGTERRLYNLHDTDLPSTET